MKNLEVSCTEFGIKLMDLGDCKSWHLICSERGLRKLLLFQFLKDIWESRKSKIRFKSTFTDLELLPIILRLKAISVILFLRLKAIINFCLSCDVW